MGQISSRYRIPLGQVPSGHTRRWAYVEAWASPVKGLIITGAAEADNQDGRFPWRLTVLHGSTVGGYKTKQAAAFAARLLSLLPIDWRTVSNVIDVGKPLHWLVKTAFRVCSAVGLVKL